MPVVLQMHADWDTCPPMAPMYLCRHMLWCAEVSQLESGHWHLTLVINTTAVSLHCWLLLNIHICVCVCCLSGLAALHAPMLEHCDSVMALVRSARVSSLVFWGHRVNVGLFSFYTFFSSSHNKLYSYSGHMWMTSWRGKLFLEDTEADGYIRKWKIQNATINIQLIHAIKAFFIILISKRLTLVLYLCICQVEIRI